MSRADHGRDGAFVLFVWISSQVSWTNASVVKQVVVGIDGSRELAGGGEARAVGLEIFAGVPVEFFWLCSFIFGTLIGSFLNVVIYRLPLGRSIVSPASACTTCNTPLLWYQNIPVLSYLALGGRCRFCGSSYSIRYAALELFAGVYFLGAAVKFDFLSAEYGKAVVLFCLSLAVFFIDFDHWIIPDSINLLGVVLGVAFSFAVPLTTPVLFEELFGVSFPSPALSVIGAGFGWMFFWGIQVVGMALAKQEAMGGGDVKYAALIGAFLGPTGGLVAFLGSFFLGAFFAIPLLLFRRGGGKDPIPFGTFMAVSAVIVLVLGTQRLLAPFEGLLLPF